MYLIKGLRGEDEGLYEQPVFKSLVIYFYFGKILIYYYAKQNSLSFYVVIKHVRIFQFCKNKVVLMSPAHITAKCMLARCNKYAHLSQPCDWFCTVHTASRGLASVCCVRRYEREVRQGRVLSNLLTSQLMAAFSLLV